MAVSEEEERHYRASAVERAGRAKWCRLLAACQRAGQRHLDPLRGEWRRGTLRPRFPGSQVLPAVRLRVHPRLESSAGIRCLKSWRYRRTRREVTGRVDDVVPHLAEAHARGAWVRRRARLKDPRGLYGRIAGRQHSVGCEGIRAEAGRHLAVAPRRQFSTL